MFMSGSVPDARHQSSLFLGELAGHADPRTTRLYDRRQKKITRNISSGFRFETLLPVLLLEA
jgi:hypothetical protein